MINLPYRFLYKLAGLTPVIGFVLCFGFLDKAETWQRIIPALVLISAAMLLMSAWCSLISRQQSAVTLRVVKIRRYRCEFSGYIAALILGAGMVLNHANDPAGIVAFLSLLLILGTDLEAGNPVAMLNGWKYYEATNEDGITFLLMTKRTPQEIIWDGTNGNAELKVCSFSDGFLIEI